METSHYKVGDIASDQRQMLEHLLGRTLDDDQQIIIQVVNQHASTGDRPTTEPAPRLPDWCRVYEGLTDQEIEELEDVVLSRADLTRPSQ
jgi:hypothetical protein